MAADPGATLERRRGPLAWLGRLETGACYVCLALLVVVTSLQVATRFLGAPFTWTEEAARILFIWMIFLGAALVTRRGGHVSIEFFVGRLPRRARRWARALAHALAATVAGVLAVSGVRLLAVTGVSASPALGVPWAVVYAVFPLAMALVAAREAGGLVRALRATAPEDPAEASPPRGDEGRRR